MGIFDQTKIGQAVDGKFVLTESELNQMLKILSEGVKLEQKRQSWKWMKWTVYFILCLFFFACTEGSLDIFGLSLWGNAGVSLFFAFLMSFTWPDSSVGEIEKIHAHLSEEFMRLGYRNWAEQLSNEHTATPYVQIGTDLEVYNRNQRYHELGGEFKYPSKLSRIASILGSYLDSKWELPLNANKRYINKKGLAQYALLFRLNRPYEDTEKSFLDTQYYWLFKSDLASGNHAPLMWRLDMKKYLAYLSNPKKY